jgi:hypothetical protein
MRYRHGDRESPAQPGKPQKEKVGEAFADVQHGSVSIWSSTLSVTAPDCAAPPGRSFTN